MTSSQYAVLFCVFICISYLLLDFIAVLYRDETADVIVCSSLGFRPSLGLRQITRSDDERTYARFPVSNVYTNQMIPSALASTETSLLRSQFRFFVTFPN